jgi:integron integrase
MGEGFSNSDGLKRYREILGREASVPVHHREFYLKWLLEFMGFCHVRELDASTPMLLSYFFGLMRKSGRKDFQIKQAHAAIRLYWTLFSFPTLNALPGKDPIPVEELSIQSGVESDPIGWEQQFSSLSSELRLRHYSGKTLKSYLFWIRNFSKFLRGRPPHGLGPSDAKAFLTHLAVVQAVSASTQNQAFSALLFFYTQVLKVDFGGLQETPRAKKILNVPTVLSRAEVHLLFGELTGVHKVFAQLIYGCGLRLGEALELRVQDLDLVSAGLVVFNGKGNKSRCLPLPRKLISDLQSHLAAVRLQWEVDLKDPLFGVVIGDSLGRKMPRALREWPWQWVFPSAKLLVIQGVGHLRRFHIHESVIQKEIKRAAEAAKLTKRVTPHTLRHSYATHLLQMGYDIRTVQELMGHNDVTTTMIYTHAVQAMAGKIISPLDI